MRFDFNDSLYNKMWDSVEGRQILSYVITEVASQYIDPVYWPTAFPLNGNPIPTAADGTASFTVKAKYPEHSTMMDLRAPLGEGRLAEEGQEAAYSGTIPDFISPVWQETAAERKYKRDLFAELGNDAPLLKGFATDSLVPRIKAGHMALDYMAMMAESTGKVRYDKGVGNKLSIYKSDIPTENFVNIGAKVATDPDCKLITQLIQIEDSFRQKWGVTFPMKWTFTKDFYTNVFLKNAEVQDQIKLYWLLDKGIASLDTTNVPNYVLTEENFNKYVVGQVDGLSPIKVVSNKQVDNGTIVSGWKEGIITLSPAGYSGETLTTNILDVQMYTSDMLNTSVSVSTASAANGLMTVINYVLPDGMLKRYMSKVVMSAAPVLTDFLWRVVVDTTKAD